MDRDSTIRKIKKCLALSKSSEPHEAAAALRQAQQLMAQLDVTEREVQLSEVHESRVKGGSTKPQLWEATLINLVARAFGCFVLLSHSPTRSALGDWRTVTYVVFIGVVPANETAGYAFEVLRRQCVRARADHVARQPRNCKQSTKSARGDAFAMAWVNGVRHLVESRSNSARNDALLKDYMDQNHPELGDVSIGDRGAGKSARAADRAAGAAAARSATLHQGVGGPLARRMLT